MPRWLPLYAVLALAVPAFAQKDRVVIRDRTTGIETVFDGDAVENPSGIKMSVSGKDRTFLAHEIVRIDFGALDAAIRLAASGHETDGLKTPATALAYYADRLKALPNANEKTKRFLAFRETYWATRVADSKTGAEFETEAKKALEKIAAFNKANAKTWEPWILGRISARLSGELGDWKAAENTLRELAAPAELPPELKFEAKAARLGYLLRGGMYPEAKSLADDLDADKAAPAIIKERVAFYREALSVLPAKDSDEADPMNPGEKKKVSPAGSKAKLEAMIAKAKEPALRGVGYGVLGEVLLAHRQTRDAMWSFLSVEMLYNQDKDERVMALNRLVKISNETNEKDGEKNRADDYLERLLKAR